MLEGGSVNLTPNMYVLEFLLKICWPVLAVTLCFSVSSLVFQSIDVVSFYIWLFCTVQHFKNSDSVFFFMFVHIFLTYRVGYWSSVTFVPIIIETSCSFMANSYVFFKLKESLAWISKSQHMQTFFVVNGSQLVVQIFRTQPAIAHVWKKLYTFVQVQKIEDRTYGRNWSCSKHELILDDGSCKWNAFLVSLGKIIQISKCVGMVSILFDDIIIIGNDHTGIQHLMGHIFCHFETKNLVPLKYYLLPISFDVLAFYFSPKQMMFQDFKV